MRDALKSYLALAGGVTEVTRQKAVDAAKALVASGEAAAEQVTSLAEDLLTQTRQNREAVVALVGFEVDRALGRVGLASADEVTALTERVRSLEGRLAQASTAAGGGPAKTGTSGGVQAGARAKASGGSASKGAAAAGEASAGKAAGGKATTGKAAGGKAAAGKKAPAEKPGA